MGAGASATSFDESFSKTAIPGSPGVIIKRRQYPKHIRHLYKKHHCNMALAISDKESSQLTTILAPWSEMKELPASMSGAEACSEDNSTSCSEVPDATSPRSVASSVEELIDTSDVLS
mmetsp:Transcript_27990/g.45032  ORF Transcript_27990/g.45032 Transcript_27990/m.45032 type:complete len:118 (-) Transcript_27990:298-651(-)